MKPVIEVVEAGTKLVKESTKNMKLLTGACYSKTNRKGGAKPNERKVEKLEVEIESLRKRQRDEEKASEK